MAKGGGKSPGDGNGTQQAGDFMLRKRTRFMGSLKHPGQLERCGVMAALMSVGLGWFTTAKEMGFSLQGMG